MWFKVVDNSTTTPTVYEFSLDNGGYDSHVQDYSSQGVKFYLTYRPYDEATYQERETIGENLRGKKVDIEVYDQNSTLVESVTGAHLLFYQIQYSAFASTPYHQEAFKFKKII